MNTTTSMQESCREVFAWLRGGDATPDPEMENRFIDIIAERVQSRLKSHDNGRPDKQVRGASALSLRNLMDEPDDSQLKSDTASETPEEQAAGYAECGLDSVELAKTLCWIASQNHRNMNMSQLQVILYVIYGVWLAQRRERLTSEHPQVWQFGPVFPRVYNKLRREQQADAESSYRTLLADRPALVGYMETCFRRYCSTPASVLTAPHVAEGTPWDAVRRRSHDKWGQQMDDAEIATWFSDRIAG